MYSDITFFFILDPCEYRDLSHLYPEKVTYQTYHTIKAQLCQLFIQ